MVARISKIIDNQVGEQENYFEIAKTTLLMSKALVATGVLGNGALGNYVPSVIESYNGEITTAYFDEPYWLSTGRCLGIASLGVADGSSDPRYYQSFFNQKTEEPFALCVLGTNGVLPSKAEGITEIYVHEDRNYFPFTVRGHGINLSYYG